MFLRGFLISFFVYRAEEKPARSTSKEFKNTEPRHVGEKISVSIRRNTEQKSWMFRLRVFFFCLCIWNDSVGFLHWSPRMPLCWMIYCYCEEWQQSLSEFRFKAVFKAILKKFATIYNEMWILNAWLCRFWEEYCKKLALNEREALQRRFFWIPNHFSSPSFPPVHLQNALQPFPLRLQRIQLNIYMKLQF